MAADTSICEVAPAIDGRGRRLLTQCAARAGDLLLREAPWAAVAFDPATTCAATLRAAHPPGRLLRCGRCQVARYVDRAAQAADWPAHKPECAALAAAGGRAPSPTIRLAARCLWRAQAGGSTAALDALESHWQDLTPAKAGLYAEMAMAVLRFMGGGGGPGGAHPLPQPKAAATLIATLAVNAHTITSPGSLDRVGLGLYVGQGSMANHGEPSPTAVQAFTPGGVLELRALDRLAAGGEVTLSYTDPSLPRPARRAALLAGYFFDIDGGDGAGPPAPPPPPSAEWTSADGLTVAVAYPARPPSAGDDPAATTALVDGCEAGGAMAWLEEEGEPAAASFPVDDGEDGDEAGGRTPARPPPPPRCRVVAWGAAAGASLSRLAQALAAAERAAEAVRACLDGGPGRRRPDVAGALAAAAAGATALAACTSPAVAPTHATVGRLAAARVRAAIAAGDWSGALAAARDATAPADAALPQASPLRARAWAERAKLAALAGEGGGDAAADAEALDAAQKAVAALRVCCPSAPLRAEMEGLVHGLQADEAARARDAHEN